MPEGLCKFCLQRRDLIEAHIIPAGFFDRIQTDTPNLLVNEHDYPKRSRKGIYDPGILCGPCDNIIGKWDQYAQETLTMNMAAFTPIGTPDNIGGWELASYDYRLLKLFFISLVWRASISTHHFYRLIAMGSELEDAARLMLRQDNPGGPHDFGVMLARFTEDLGHAFFDPHSERFNGVNYVRFYIAGYIAYIEVDQRPYRADLAYFLLAEGQPLRIIRRSIRDGGELEVIQAILSSPKNRPKRPSLG